MTMGLLDYLEAAAARRQKRWELRMLARAQRVAAGLTVRQALVTFGFDAKLLIAAAVIGLFGWAYASNVDDDTMKGALIAGFAGAWGFYLGSSSGAGRNAAQAESALRVAHDAVKALPVPAQADVTLKPGETARAAEEEEVP